MVLGIAKGLRPSLDSNMRSLSCTEDGAERTGDQKHRLKSFCHEGGRDGWYYPELGTLICDQDRR